MSKATTFDEDELQTELKGMAVLARAAFAAGCAGRLVSCADHVEAEADRRSMEETSRQLRALWLLLEGGAGRVDELQSESDAHAISSAESDNPLIEDAAAATHYACQSFADDDSVRSACWAAERVVNSIDSFLFQTDFAEIDVNEVEARGLFWNHPLTKTELARQRRDLALLTGPETDIEAAMRTVYESTKHERAF